MKLYAMLALSIAAGVWSGVVGAAPTPMLQCAACTPLQEENKIRNLNRNGWFFVYNLQNARVRKFNTYLIADDDRSAGGGGKDEGVDTLEDANAFVNDAADELNRVQPGWVRVVEEYPVDPSVQKIFNSLLQTERERPGVNFGRNNVSFPIGSLGQTEGSIGVRDFDPREIAWTRNEANLAEYEKFMKRLEERLGKTEDLSRISPLLGQVLATKIEMKNASFSGGTSGASIGINVSDVPGEDVVDFCDNQFNCVSVKMVSDGKKVQSTFVRVRDRDGSTLPAKGQAVNANWGPTGRDTASAYVEWLRRKGISTEVIGGSSGCSYALACVAVVDTNLLSCQLFCR